MIKIEQEQTGLQQLFSVLLGFLASISAQLSKNITKITKNADFKKTVPPVPPVPPHHLLALLAPLGIKKKLGRFLASITAQV